MKIINNINEFYELTEQQNLSYLTFMLIGVDPAKP